MQGLVDLLNDSPLAGLMLVVAAGFTLGRISWRGIALGPAGGTLLVALFMGSMGLGFREMYGTKHPELTLGALGFCLFIYSVGFEAGPRFFSALRGGSGWRFVVVGAVVNVTALLLAVLCGKLMHLGEAVTAGVLSGALTSAPTYAAAIEVTRDPGALSVAFALTYPVGLAGVVVLSQFLPRLMRDDLGRGIPEGRRPTSPTERIPEGKWQPRVRKRPPNPRPRRARASGWPRNRPPSQRRKQRRNTPRSPLPAPRRAPSRRPRRPEPP